MGKPFKIQGQPIEAGQHAQVVLNIYKLPTHTLIEIPVFIHPRRHGYFQSVLYHFSFDL